MGEEFIRELIFKEILRRIKENDTNYEIRYGLVLLAVGMAVDMKLRTGIRIDENEPQWPVIYIDLPTGQVSWHVSQYAAEWDGHSTEEKYRRIDEYLK